MTDELKVPTDDEIVVGRVKWFDAVKGFGFVISDEGGPDILLHANVLRNFGQGSVADQSRVELKVQKTDRGLQAVEVLGIEPPEGDIATTEMTDLAIDASNVPLTPARVKWFDTAKGFGFANVYGHSEDVFLHIEVLRRCGLADLQAGEAVCLRIIEGERGQMAAEVHAWDYALSNN
ncbi:MAG: cold shock domain-containing protein [Litoreibacter sp.]|nr:cold shock domain-containing protein [Boseongicola sp.]NNK79837.1 cold shock domain-containing protein [Litoreibacter sp.]